MTDFTESRAGDVPPGSGSAPSRSDREDDAGPVDVELIRTLTASATPSDAVAACQTALSAAPNQPDLLELYAVALCRAGRLPDGIARFEQVVDLRPTSAAAHFNLAAACRQAGRLADARRHLEVTLRLDPHYSRAIVARQSWAEQDSDAPAPPETDVQPVSSDPSIAPAAPSPTPPQYADVSDADVPAPDLPAPGVSHTSTVGQPSPPGFEAKPLPKGAPMEVFDDDAPPSFWFVARGLVSRPGHVIEDDLNDYCAAAESFGPIAILVVVAALLLSVSFMFDPGGATRRDPVTLVVILVVSVLLGCVMIAVQSGLMALLCASSRDSAFADHYRSVAVRFGLIWGITTGITMTIALILVVFGVSGAALVLVAVSVIWGFALDVAVFSSYYSQSWGRSFLAALLATGVAIGLGLAVLLRIWNV